MQTQAQTHENTHKCKKHTYKYFLYLAHISMFYHALWILDKHIQRFKLKDKMTIHVRVSPWLAVIIQLHIYESSPASIVIGTKLPQKFLEWTVAHAADFVLPSAICEIRVALKFFSNNVYFFKLNILIFEYSTFSLNCITTSVSPPSYRVQLQNSDVSSLSEVWGQFFIDLQSLQWLSVKIILQFLYFHVV